MARRQIFKEWLCLAMGIIKIIMLLRKSFGTLVKTPPPFCYISYEAARTYSNGLAHVKNDLRDSSDLR